MPTQALFDKYPPFPSGIPVLPVPRVSYAKLLLNDAAESEALWDAATRDGFLLLDFSESEEQRGLMDDMSRVFGISQRFFDLPLEEKMNYKLASGNTGYKPTGMIKTANGKGDVAEICAVPQDDILKPDGDIPVAFGENRQFLAGVTHSLRAIAFTILSHLEKQLDLPPGTLEECHLPSKHSVTVLRCLHYPPQKEQETDAGREGPVGRVDRVTLPGHTDNGSLTVLFTAAGGLQVRPESGDSWTGLESEDGWLWVRPEPHCAIVNVGDSLTQWTGGVLRSGVHRVVSPPGKQICYPRQSVGYFLKPAEEAPMHRLHGGRIPVLASPEEAALDAQVGTYDTWHKLKTEKLLKGKNLP